MSGSRLGALLVAVWLLLVPSTVPAQAARFDTLVRGGMVYDGTGGPPRRADVGLRGDRIAAVGDLREAKAAQVIDASGLAVAPGFINMLSHAEVPLIGDGRSQSDIRQGVTTEVFGEGSSMGPLNEAMRRRLRAGQRDIRFDVEWTTLAGFLKFLERRGVSANVGSFVGAATVRTHVVGLDDRPATPDELRRMRELVSAAMQEGAFGVSSALIYAPGSYASTEELIELCKAAAPYKGMYISHMRSEDTHLLEAIDELVRIAREGGVAAEIFHFKASGRGSWPSMGRAIERVERARRDGLRITADMYLYTASGTGLSSRIPPWAHDGGGAALYKRLEDPAARRRIAEAMRKQKFDNVLLTRFRTPALQPLQGKRLVDVARERGTTPLDTALDLIAEDRSRVDAMFMDVISEDNIRLVLKQPWVSFGSDGGSMSGDEEEQDEPIHPRAYGNFARLLGHYVRDQGLLSLQEAVRRLSALPAANLGLDRRGLLKEGMYADLAIFDPRTIADRATYEAPRRYAVGMRHVFVNGVQVLRDGEHTGAKPGRALWGPGKTAGQAPGSAK